MKITNDTQLAAVKARVEAWENFIKANKALDAIIGDVFNKGDKDLRAAIAEYESREVELSENELNILRFEILNWGNYKEWKGIYSRLKEKGMLDGDNRPTPAGRAYLDRNQKKWEVWCWEGDKKDERILISSYSEFEANWFARERRKVVAMCVTIEVREVNA